MPSTISGAIRPTYVTVCAALLLMLTTLAGINDCAALAIARQSAPKLPPATDRRRPVELRDFHRFESASTPAISPDGRFVAYVRTFIIEAENRRQNEIWLATTDGSAPPRRLTEQGASASSPHWSPDGSLLVFSSRSRRSANAAGADDGSIWFLRMDQVGAKPFQLLAVTTLPVFSPDNRWIAYTN